MYDFEYIVNTTEYDNSFFKSVIQSTTGKIANNDDVNELLEDIEIFFQEKVKNNQKQIVKHIIDYIENKLNFFVIKGSSEDIYDLYMGTTKFGNLKAKKIIPVFSSKIKIDLHKQSRFFTFKNYKYLNYYISYRVTNFLNLNNIKISLRNFILNYLQKKKKSDLLLDILNLNALILDGNLNFKLSFENDENSKYIILYKDNKDRYKNVSIVMDDKKLNLLDKNEDSKIIELIKMNKKSDQTYEQEETTTLDTIIEEIENITDNKEDFLSNINLLD